MHIVLSHLAERCLTKHNNLRRAWTQPQQPTEMAHLHTPAMDAICSSCHAVMFPWEMTKKTKTFSACCRHGTIQLQPFKDPSPSLQTLFDWNTPQSQQFMANIRHYNGLVSMASRSVSGKMVASQTTLFIPNSFNYTRHWNRHIACYILHTVTFVAGVKTFCDVYSIFSYI